MADARSPPPSNDWFDWLHAEDWFNATCGADAPQLRFDGLPSCARRCLQRTIFDYKMLLFLRVAIWLCKILRLERNSTIANWYASECAVSLDTASVAMGAVDASTAVIPPDKPWDRLRWYEKLTLGVLAVTILVFVLHLVQRKWQGLYM